MSLSNLSRLPLIVQLLPLYGVYVLVWPLIVEAGPFAGILIVSVAAWAWGKLLSRFDRKDTPKLEDVFD